MEVWHISGASHDGICCRVQKYLLDKAANEIGPSTVLCGNVAKAPARSIMLSFHVCHDAAGNRSNIRPGRDERFAH